MRTEQLSVLKRHDALLALLNSRAAGAGVAATNFALTGNTPVAPSDLTGTGTQIVLAAMDLTPKVSGLFHVDWTITYTLAAADTVKFIVEAVPAVTAITGGSSVGTIKLFYEHTTPLVVTGGAPVLSLTTNDQIATGNIAHVTRQISGMVLLGGALNTRQAIQLNVVTTGGQNISAISLWGFANEIAA